MDATHTDYLFVAGEIGIAFTGFAGLVTVLAGRLGPSGSSVDPSLARLSIVLTASLLLVMSALLPYVLHQFLDPPVAWAVSAAGLSVALVLFTVQGMIRPGLEIRRSGRTFNAGLFYFTTSLSFVSAIVLLASAFVAQSHTASLYVLTIYVLVWVSASMLFRLFVLLAANREI